MLYTCTLVKLYSVDHPNSIESLYIRERQSVQVMCYFYFYFLFFLVGGKEGNASCTVAPLSTMCGTPARLAVGPMCPLDKTAA